MRLFFRSPWNPSTILQLGVESLGSQFEEPLSVIDPKEKYVLRRKIREVQRQLNITTIYVTHDQHEALTFADNVTVIKDGQVVQTGTPHQLHAEPESAFIGYFIGSPGMNLLDCEFAENALNFADFCLPISTEMKDFNQ